MVYIQQSRKIFYCIRGFWIWQSDILPPVQKTKFLQSDRDMIFICTSCPLSPTKWYLNLYKKFPVLLDVFMCCLLLLFHFSFHWDVNVNSEFLTGKKEAAPQYIIYFYVPSSIRFESFTLNTSEPAPQTTRHKHFKTTHPKVTCFLRKLWKGSWYT